MLLRTRVGADSISARSAMPQTPAGGYGIRPYNGFFNVAANRETTILALPRTCVGDDACIVPHPAAAQTHRVGGRFRGRHFGAGQSLRPRLMARPPPFDKGGKLQGGACGQPGNHDLDVIANPCRGRFYIGPVCGAANVPGGYGIRPYNGFFNVAANRETTILALPRTCVGDDACIVPHPAAAQTHRVGGRCRKACRGGARPARKPCGGGNTRGLVWPPCQRGLAAAKAADWGIV